VVAERKPLHALAQRLDNPGSLVPGHDRGRHVDGAVEQIQVVLADAA
jgi:hypothetical protein